MNGRLIIWNINNSTKNLMKHTTDDDPIGVETYSAIEKLIAWLCDKLIWRDY
jgi:hypothetical protein